MMCPYFYRALLPILLFVVVSSPATNASESPVLCGSDQPDVLLIGGAANAESDAPHTHAHDSNTPMTGTMLDYFTNDGRYMPRVHCLVNEAGGPDWPWIIALLTLTVTVIAGYLRIFVFWRRAYMDEAPEDRNKKMMQLAYIFLFCAVCGYGFSLLAYFWPAYRLLAVFMVVLNIVTWAFAFSLKDFRVSLSANRMRRELEEQARNKTEELERLVAERTADLEQVREQTRQLALVASKTDNAVVITDAHGLITWVNRSFTRVTGYTIEEVLGQKPGSFLQGPDTDPQTVQRIREAIAKHEPISEEILNYTKSGEPYWLDVEIQPIRDEDGAVTHFMAIESDITKDKAINQELAEAKDQAESANLAKSQFIANMSHEIRTPLTGIIGFADLLANRKSVDDPTRMDWAKTIANSSKHLQALLNDVLDFSKIEAGKLEIENLPIKPHEVIAEIASIFRVNASHKGLSLELNCPNPLPETIQTDPTRLRQALSNLVGNAIKFTDAGSIRIEADTVIDRDSLRELLRIDVVDTGIGMSQEQTEKLFNVFAQADVSVSRKFGGTGLGLAISKHLAVALGGDLAVESRPGFGSRFTLTIDPGDISEVPRINASESQSNELAPVEPSNAESIEPMPQHVAQINEECSDKPQILLADDGPTNRKFITITLNHAGYDVTAVENGLLALNKLKAEPTRYQLVLMDMQMPEMDGYEATRQARQAGVTTPIYALTASVLKGDRERCMEAGCDDYLSKPIEPDQLLRTVAQAIESAPKPTDTASDQPQANTQDIADIALADDAPILPSMDPDYPEFLELLTSYLAELQDQIDSASSALEQEDADALAAIAHRILGSGGTLGYDCLTQPAESLQSAAHARQLDDAAQQLEALTKLCDRIKSGIEQYRGQTS